MSGLPYRWLIVAVTAAFAVWGGIMAFAPEGGLKDSQSRVFVAKGSYCLSDYYMPWKCANEGYVQSAREDYLTPDGRTLGMEESDRCYPAFAMLPYRLLHYSNVDAVAFDLFGALLFLLAVIFCCGNARDLGSPDFGRLSPLIFIFSAPFLFTLERANSIWYSAAAVAVFLAWWNDEKPWLRYAAAVCLAIASALKLAPAVLAVLYFRNFLHRGKGEWIYRELLCFVTVTAVLLSVPFVWFGGWEGFTAFLANASENGRVMSVHSAFGIHPFVCRVKGALGMDIAAGIFPWKCLTQLLGVGCLLLALVPRKLREVEFFAVSGLLLVPGNMMYYGFLYLLPLIILSRIQTSGRLPLVLWFVILCPLQVVICNHTVNMLLSNLAFLSLIGYNLFAMRDCGERAASPFVVESPALGLRGWEIWYNTRQRMKITVITSCFNAAGTVRDTLESVAGQKLPEGVELEHLVVDGGSKDGTVDIIREFESHKYLRWISEKDRGLYDAINKGIGMATGEVIGILNADDVFESDDVIAKIAAGFAEDVDAVYADIRFVKELGGPTVRYCSGKWFRNWHFRFATFPAHPSTFVRKECFDKYGLYSLDYRICADFEMMLRLFYVNGIRAKYLPMCTTVMRTGGASTGGLKSNIEINREDLRALRANGVWSCMPLIYLKYFAKIWGFVFKRGA